MRSRMAAKVLCGLVVAACLAQCHADASYGSRQLQQYSSAVQVLDEEGNYVGDINMDYEPIQGHALQSSSMEKGALQQEVAKAEAQGGKCRKFHARAIPMFDSPSDVSDTVSSVMVPVTGRLLSASVEMNLTHTKAGSAGVKLFYGNSPTNRPHLVLKDPCGTNEPHCDHFGQNWESVLFSDESVESFPQDEMEAPFTGEYKPVQPLSISKVGAGLNAGEGGTFGRWTLESHIPGEQDAPDMEWTLQLCYVPDEASVEGVLDEMDVGETLEIADQQAGAMAASFVRRITGRLGSRIPGPARGFMAYMGGLFVELAACYGIGEAYRILELWYCNTFGGPIFLGIQFVTDPTCPTDLPALSTWLIPILEGAQSY